MLAQLLSRSGMIATCFHTLVVSHFSFLFPFGTHTSKVAVLVRSLSLGSESGQNKASKLNYWGVGVGVVGGGGRGGVELGSLF